MPGKFSLNPDAAPFVPGSSPTVSHISSADLDSEEQITQEELDELEMCEEWVAAMAGIEEAEIEFLVDLALDLAPPKRVAEVERSSAAASHPRSQEH